MVKQYTPEKGDIVFVNFNPQAGKEQSGKRPALVISPKIYNETVGLAIMTPVTSQEKGYPFEVKIPETLKTSGVILADHVKSMDWKKRKTKLIEKLPEATFTEVIQKIETLIK